MPDQSQETVQGAFTASINYPIIPEEKVYEKADPLSLDIDDDELVKIIDKRIDNSVQFYKEHYDLPNRRKKNETYYFGRQVSEKERRNDLKPYESRNLDNVLYEIEATLKPLAMSHLPDLIVMPGQDTPEQQESAKNLSKIINSQLKKRQTRNVLAMAFKHLPVYFTGIIKVRWDPECGPQGDYLFESIHPNNIVFDHMSPSNNVDEMSFVAQYLPLTVQELIMQFPDKEQDIYDLLHSKGLIVGTEPTWKEMATSIKIIEVWATWYSKPSADEDKEELTEEAPPEDEQAEWDTVELVIWKYDKLILKKMKNPNYDYEGEEQTFTYQTPGDETTKQGVSPEMSLNSILTGQPIPNVEKEMVYHNYFDRPKKPFFFMGYDQWGKQPLDETSRIEQNIRNQETLDKRGKQINETLDTRTKHVFSKDGGLKPDDIERMDMNDPNQDVLVEGDVNKVHAVVPADRPTPQEFNDLQMTRDRMYALSGSNAVRGQMQTDVATTNQIARESDFTRADDLVEDTINSASEWIAGWSLQLIKLRYTEDHFQRLLGDKGTVVFMKLNRDQVQDGMEVMIKSSATDKLKAQNNAMQLAQLGSIDPLQLFKDMDLDDPEGRAEQFLTFKMDPNTYIVKYLQDMQTTPQMIQGLNATTPGQSQMGVAPGAPQPGQGGTPPVPMPQVPSVGNPAPAAMPPQGAPMGSPRGL